MELDVTVSTTNPTLALTPQHDDSHAEIPMTMIATTMTATTSPTTIAKTLRPGDRRATAARRERRTRSAGQITFRLRAQAYRALQLLVVGCLFITGASVALKTDRNQPALINADEIEIDFKTGDRVYIGNVTIVQGSIRLNADKLIATFKDSKLERATAFGSPAVFKQRPDDANGDVVGTGNKMVIDETTQLVTLTDNASLTQADGATISSESIIYDMETEKLKASGGTKTKKPAEGSNNSNAPDSNAPTTTPTSTEPASAVADTNSGDKAVSQTANAASDSATPATNADQPSITNESGRMRIVIPPRKKSDN